VLLFGVCFGAWVVCILLAATTDISHGAVSCACVCVSVCATASLGATVDNSCGAAGSDVRSV
jgi:hypothetical protein